MKKLDTFIKQKFEIYQEEVQYWITKFGLTNYEVTTTLSPETNKSTQASCDASIDTMAACINLNSEWALWDTTVTDKNIRSGAFHEVCELLLMETTSYLVSFYSDGLCDHITHNVIMRLQNSVFEESYERRFNVKKKKM